MGKQSGKNKKSLGDSSYEANSKSFKSSENSPRAPDKDTALFISMSQELKDEGNRLFQIRDYEGAMLKYDKAIKLLPRNHINVSYLRSNIAECYMQLGIAEFPKAIHECNLALEVTPKYTKALLKRARCYEALNRLDLALRDVGTVLAMEQNNLMAVEIEERVKTALSRSGNESPVHLVPLPEYFELLQSPRTLEKTSKEDGNNASKEKANEESCNGPRRERESDWKILYRQVKEKESDEKGLNGQHANKERESDWMSLYRQVLEKEACERKALRERKAQEKLLRKSEEYAEEKKTEDKVVVEEEKIISGNEERPGKTVKLVFGEDIRCAQIPLGCDLLKLREIVADRFPSSKAVLIKYRDQEGDLVTITTAEELKLAEQSAAHKGTFKLFVVEVSPEQDPFFEKIITMGNSNEEEDSFYPSKKRIAGPARIESACISDWIVQFAQFFKNYVGFDVDSYLDLHENAIKLYSDAMEETVTSDEAQELFAEAADKFQEMAALALFNWGNVHMARARKRVYFTEDSSTEQVLSQVKNAYDWAIKEYVKAGEKYEHALKTKPNFYEAVLALGQQQFERAKLSWYYAVGTSADLSEWPSTEALELYNYAEENMEKGMQMWEAAEAQRMLLTKAPSQIPSKAENLLSKMKLGGVLKNVKDEEAAEQAATMRSQINVIWGTMLYERSIMEFKLGLPVWQECLEVSLEKFELAGASPSDIAVMVKNHCSNDATLEGLGFNINEIIQAWNEMYEAKRWQSSIPSFRVEPLLRRRVSKLYHALEHA